MSEYPEHEKLSELSDKRDHIQEFMEWIRRHDTLVLCSRYIENGKSRHFAMCQSRRDIMADFLGIDKDRLEAEKQRMLENQRELNGK